jgi:glycosyltransferase involved in cell wall biosynthesis
MGFLADKHDDYYLSFGRLGERKRTDLLIQACNRLKRRLVVAGSGPEEKRLKALAGPTIEFVGYVSDADLPKLYANCRAFLFAADEDFGIAPVEAQAFGRPVIAYGHGGSLETVRVNNAQGMLDTGLYFNEQTVESVMDGIIRFEAKEGVFIPANIQENAQEFDISVFVEKIQKLVSSLQLKGK